MTRGLRKTAGAWFGRQGQPRHHTGCRSIARRSPGARPPALPGSRRSLAALVACAALLVAAATVSTQAPADQDPEFTAGDGRGWDPSTLGNHRAIIDVPSAGHVAHVVLPWRRPDPAPEGRNLIVTDAAGARVRNVQRGAVSRERGEIWFEPASGAGRYHVYYMPYRSTGRSNYPTVTYPPFEETADPAWLGGVADTTAVEARVVRFESIDAFNGFAPMQVIATAGETDAVVGSHPGARFLVFPEDRDHPIRMTRDLPRRWIAAGPRSSFAAAARRGEYLAFQFGVYALANVSGLRVRFSDLHGAAGTIAATRLSCINTDGVSWDGTPFSRALDVGARTVQAIWCGADVPADAKPGVYGGAATLIAREAPPVDVHLDVTVLEESVPDGGADEPWKQTRLRWLNSTLAQPNDVVAPYTPVTVRGRDVGVLGRTVTVGPSGLPARLRSFFTAEMTGIGSSGHDVLAAPITLAVEDGGGSPVAWQRGSIRFVERSPGTVRWETNANAPGLTLGVSAAMEFDGYLDCRLALTATRDVALGDVRLEIPFGPAAATYMMGLGQRGARRPPRLDWRWDVAAKNQDGAWLGAVNAGLFFSLRDDRYVRPLNTNFYRQGPLRLPSSWGNDGKGAIKIRERDRQVLVTASSGSRSMKAGETQHFDVVFIVTPFHPIDTDFQWRTRFYHKYAEPESIAATGATIANIHHATPVNPWINYPFIAHRELKAYVDAAHRVGLKVKIYDTIRELSNRAWELFPLRSLGHEVFTPGPGGGAPWLQEHVGDDYRAGWYVPENGDAALLNGGGSRWHNYYVEGLRWLVQHTGIDGIYVDDVAYDRTTMKRVKRVLTADGHPGIIDLHSANQYNERDGFVSSALLYLEHFPYVNRLWFGEYFDYQGTSPDYWLTEVSGIPFGLMGEMLEGGGNPWRGMVYGMTNRLPWSEAADPRPLWRAWDAFGMAGTRMIGYWSPAAPVRTNRPDVLATVYSKRGRALVALASWAPADVDVTLAIDWTALGLDPARGSIEAPAIERFQPARQFAADAPIPVRKGEGWVLILGDTR